MAAPRNEGGAPVGRSRTARHVGADVAGQRESAGVDTEPASRDFILGDVRVLGQRQHDRNLSRYVFGAYALEEKAVERHAIAAPDVVDEKIGREPVHIGQLVTPKIGIVRGQLNVEARAPAVPDRKAPRAEETAVPLAAPRLSRSAGIVAKGSLQPHAAFLPALTIFGLQHRAGPCGDERIDGEVARRTQGEIIRQLEE